MKIEIFKGHQVPEAQGLCVVIDVLRAFTTAAFAFGSGAKEILFVSSPEEAFMKQKRDPAVLLMGEQEGKRIEGFHFENSPSEIQRMRLTGCRMVQSTSSGTKGVIGSKHAPQILIASFVVADATVKRILELQPASVSFIATGRTNGDEDIALAEYLKSKLLRKPVDLEHLLNRVRNSPAAQRMREGPIAYKDWEYDLELALKINHFSFAMEVFKEREELVGKAIKVDK